jgi:hypothetical protein
MSERFILRHGRRVIAGALAVVALVAWTWGGADLASDLFGARSANLSAQLEFAGWIAGIVLFLSAFLWVAFGRKVVRIDDGKLTVEAEIFALTFYRSEPLITSETRNIRVEEYQFGYRGKRLTRYRLTAESHGKQRHVLSDLSETQANSLRHWEPLSKLQAAGVIPGEERPRL